MTREEAIKFASHAQSLTDLPEVKEFYALAESALREQEERRWIPSTERLPENIGLYLVIETHWLDGSPCIKIAKWNTIDWFTADRKSKEITPRVTHWMHLPKLPKEDGNDRS